MLSVKEVNFRFRVSGLDKGTKENLDRVLQDMTEALDESYFESYSDDIAFYMLEKGNADLDQVYKNFEKNYSSGSIGLRLYDDLRGADIRALIGDEALYGFIKEASYIEASDYYTKWNEVASWEVGVVDYEIDILDIKAYDEGLCDILKSKGFDDFDTFTVYGRPFDRFILKIDPDLFLKAASRAIASAKRKLKSKNNRKSKPEVKALSKDEVKKSLRLVVNGTVVVD